MARDSDGRGQTGLGLRHQPEAHLGDDPEIRLGEQAVDDRAHPVAELLPGLRTGQSAHAGAHQLAVGQHDLHAAVRFEVIAVRQGSATCAVVERVPHQAPPARIGTVDPQLQLVLADMPVEVEIGDARLDQHARVLLADLQDAVHPPQL